MRCASTSLLVLLEALDALAQLDLDRLDRAQRGRARRHVVARRIHREARHPLQDVAGQRIEHVERLDLVVEQRHAHRVLGVLRREDVDHVAAHAERAAPELDVVALVLHLRQALDARRAATIFSPSRRCRIMPWYSAGSPIP